MNIVRLSSSVDIFASKERPKKIIFRNEKGFEYYFLCKQERKGDLRKDLRMMEYVSIINHILASDPEGKSRHLQLNTFVGFVTITFTITRNHIHFQSHSLSITFTFNHIHLKSLEITFT